MQQGHPVLAFDPSRLSRRVFLRRAAAVGVSAAFVGALEACSSQAPAAPTPAASTAAAPAATTPPAAAAATAAQSTPLGAAGGTLTFGAWQTPDTMDAQKTGLAATSRILSQAN